VETAKSGKEPEWESLAIALLDCGEVAARIGAFGPVP
jgi:hypothetical protein